MVKLISVLLIFLLIPVRFADKPEKIQKTCPSYKILDKDLALRLYNFSYSPQVSTKFILLINVKMPTIVGILTFMSMINATSERLKARNLFYLSVF